MAQALVEVDEQPVPLRVPAGGSFKINGVERGEAGAGAAGAGNTRAAPEDVFLEPDCPCELSEPGLVQWDQVDLTLKKLPRWTPLERRKVMSSAELLVG